MKRRALMLFSLASMTLLIGGDCRSGECVDGCPDLQFCCEGVCAPTGTLGCGCSNDLECSGGDTGADEICCGETDTAAGECRPRASCAPAACDDDMECAGSLVCCELGPNMRDCRSQADCPCQSASQCAFRNGGGDWECCEGVCVGAPMTCDDAGVDDAGMPPIDASTDAGPPPAGCGDFSAPVDLGADFVTFGAFDGAPALITGGVAGAMRFHAAADGAMLEERVVSDRRVYSILSFLDPADPTIRAFLTANESGASYIDRADGTWSFVLQLYGINDANVVQAALLTVGGVASGLVTANNTSGRLDLVRQNSFGTWADLVQAVIPSAGRLSGLACVPDSTVCVAATDANPSEYFRVDWSLGTSDPGFVVSLGTAGNSARNGACDALACAFAEIAAGAATIFNMTTSPPTVAATVPVGPEPLGVSAAVIGGVAGFVMMTSDDKVHFLSGAPTATSVRTYSAPGSCAASGPRTAVVFGDDCVAALCPDPAGYQLRASDLGPPD